MYNVYISLPLIIQVLFKGYQPPIQCLDLRSLGLDSVLQLDVLGLNVLQPQLQAEEENIERCAGRSFFVFSPSPLVVLCVRDGWAGGSGDGRSGDDRGLNGYEDGMRNCQYQRICCVKRLARFNRLMSFSESPTTTRVV
jgi:hypothetical protein